MAALGTGVKALAKAAMEALEKGDIKLATKLHTDAVAAVPKAASRAEKKVVEDVADKISAKNLEMADAPSSTPIGDLMPEDALNRLATPDLTPGKSVKPDPNKINQDTPLSGNKGTIQGERKLLPEPALEGEYIPEAPKELGSMLALRGSPLEKATPTSTSTDLVPYGFRKGKSTDFVSSPDGQVGRGGETIKADSTDITETLPERFPELNKSKATAGAGAAAAGLGTWAMSGDQVQPGQMFPNLPKMDVEEPASKGIKVAEAPTTSTETAPKTEKKQKAAPANLQKRTAAAQEGFQEGVDKINAAIEKAPTEEARKKYDDTLTKLNSLKTRIDAFDSKERQILAYERIGDMLARAFANLGAGITAAKQGVTVNPLKLEAADQASRYSDLQALSKQRYADLGDERDLATKTYTQELKSIEEKNKDKFDRDKLAKQESENQKDRDLKWKIANLERASRESIASGRTAGRGTSEQFKIDKEIFDSADNQVQLREKEKQQILASKKLPKALIDAMGAQYPDLDGDQTALLQKWVDVQDGLIQQAKQMRTKARLSLQGSPELASIPEAPGVKVSEVPTPPADSTVRMIAPDGRILQVPESDVPRMESLGAKRK